jgi:hypothetical protein
MSGGTQFTNTFSNQQWSNAPPMETDQLKIMSSGGYTMQPASNPPPTPAPSNYHQKSSERMKEDESKFDNFSIIFLLINFLMKICRTRRNGNDISRFVCQSKSSGI